MKLCNLIISQLRIMISKRGFWISFFMVLLYALGSYCYNIAYYWGEDISSIYARSSLACIYMYGAVFKYFQLLFPFLIVFPFSCSYFEDVENKSIGFLVRRSGKKNYYIAKTIACFIGSFMIIVIPFLINLVLVQMTFPNTLSTEYGDIDSEVFFLNMYDSERMRWLLPNISFFIKHSFMYELFVIVSLGVFAGILGIVALAASVYIRKYKILIFLPVYLLFFVLDNLGVFINNMDFELLGYVTVNRDPFKYYFLFFGICILLLGISSILLIRQSKKEIY